MWNTAAPIIPQQKPPRTLSVHAVIFGTVQTARHMTTTDPKEIFFQSYTVVTKGTAVK